MYLKQQSKIGKNRIRTFFLAPPLKKKFEFRKFRKIRIEKVSSRMKCPQISHKNRHHHQFERS